MVSAATIVQARSKTVPWIACGGRFRGSWTVRSANAKRPSRMRPANGTIG